VRVFDQIGGGEVQVKVVGRGADFFSWSVFIGNTTWEIYECSIATTTELELLLTKTYSRSLL
jgi:hypothetical protein